MNLHAKKKSHEKLNYVSKMRRRRSKITKYLFLATTHNGWGVKRSYSNVLRRLLLIFLQPGVFFRLIVKDTTCRFQNATKNRHFNFNMRKFRLLKKFICRVKKLLQFFSTILFENVLLVILNDLYRTHNYCLLKIIKSYCTVHTFPYYSNFML